MALFIGRSLLSQSIASRTNPCKFALNNIYNNARCITIKVVPKPQERKETYDERNMRLGRELSPHLTIYKIQLTSLLSISHRFTGIALTGYATVLGLGALVLSHDFSHYITMIEGLHLSTPTLIVLKSILAFPAAFHTCNGVRHLLWDLGRFLKIKEVYSTGYAMVGSSVALTLLLALL